MSFRSWKQGRAKESVVPHYKSSEFADEIRTHDRLSSLDFVTIQDECFINLTIGKSRGLEGRFEG